MKSFAVTRSITAPPEAVWALLTDAAGWPSWDPGMKRIEGSFALGEKVTFHTTMSERAFPVKVTAFEPAQRMVLSGGMPLGLFKGERTFTLTARDGGTELHTEERFTGPLVSVFPIPDLQPAFEQFADGIKARAEAASTGA
jgi:uncharacterized protein YndB with AHSA1/START domain